MVTAESGWLTGKLLIDGWENTLEIVQQPKKVYVVLVFFKYTHINTYI